MKVSRGRSREINRGRVRPVIRAEITRLVRDVIYEERTDIPPTAPPEKQSRWRGGGEAEGLKGEPPFLAIRRVSRLNQGNYIGRAKSALKCPGPLCGGCRDTHPIRVYIGAARIKNFF